MMTMIEATTPFAAIDTNTKDRKMGDGHSTTKTGSIFSGEKPQSQNKENQYAKIIIDINIARLVDDQ